MIRVAHRLPATAAACQELADAGANVFEVDVQLSGGVPVVSHFLPLLGIRRWLEHDSGHFRWYRTASRDIALADALAMIPSGCEVMLDLKEVRLPRRRAANQRILEVLGGTTRYYVSGGYPSDLAFFAAAGVRTWRTLKMSRDIRRFLRGSEHADGLSVRHRLLNARTVAALSAHTPQIIAWTVNDVARAGELVQLGVGGITTDNTDVLSLLAADTMGA